MNVCTAQEVLYCPCKHFTTSRVCSNSRKCNYLEKADHKKKEKKTEFKENGVKKKLIKTGVIYMDNCANDS